MELKNGHVPSHQSPLALHLVRNNYRVVFVLEDYSSYECNGSLNGPALTWGQTILHHWVRRHRLAW